ncbi:hypothetical protein [Cellulomonas sp. NS3]|uniref:hypothetical protein n=1 Tax=Cellulomonas sp. NS3 TaxID=2973977 RepID=UPI00216229F1|nr:hypothetical protein [Cellulomonas sp. NS3]
MRAGSRRTSRAWTRSRAPHLEALRSGRRTVLRGASDDLVELLRFAGLVDVLRVETVVSPIRRPAGDAAP